MNIYLDIDGVILANDKNLANYAEEFIKYLVQNHTVYWLTTHCMDGDASLAVENVGKLCTLQTRELLKQIKPTKWSVSKTEAIDFTQPFLWFDDDLYPEERQELVQHNALKSWIEVDLKKDPNHLKTLSKNI